MDDSRSTLAEQLRKLRLEKGFATARAFAEALGIKENRYTRYERGQSIPKLPVLRDICRHLGISPNELFGWEASEADTPAADAVVRPSHGFAEAASPFATKDAPSTDRDAAAWRLAAALASHRADTISGGPPDLRSMRETGELYLQLRQEPYAVIARYLQSVVPGRHPPEREAAVAREIEVFLSVIGTAGRS